MSTTENDKTENTEVSKSKTLSMNVGMNLLLWTTDIDDRLYPILEKLKAEGYSGVEIPIGDVGTKRYRDLGKKIKEFDLRCTAVTSVFEDGNPASPDPSIRAKAVEQLKWRIDMAKEMDAKVVCGPYHSAFAYFSGEPPRDDERKYSTEVMRQVAEYAGENDILMTPEALNRFECYLYNTLADISVMIRDVDHPNMKMIFDTHHANIEEKNSGEAILKYKDLIGHVHISESDRGTPGSGQINWDPIFKSLQEINYNGWMTIESFSRNNPVFASNINVWRNYQPTTDEVYKDGLKFINDMWSKHS